MLPKINEEVTVTVNGKCIALQATKDGDVDNTVVTILDDLGMTYSFPYSYLKSPIEVNNELVT